MQSDWRGWKLLGVIVGVFTIVLTVICDLMFATERMRRSNGPYMTRYYLLGWPSRMLARTGVFPNLYLQQFHQSDDPVPHNHPRWFLSLVLRGGYVEHINGVWWWRYPGTVNYIPVRRYHYITLLDLRGCWTLCLVGPTWGRKWGFCLQGKHISSSVYKAEVLGGGA